MMRTKCLCSEVLWYEHWHRETREWRRMYFLLLCATAAFRTQLASHPQENPTTCSSELYGSYICCTEVGRQFSCFGIELRSSFTLLEVVPGAQA